MKYIQALLLATFFSMLFPLLDYFFRLQIGLPPKAAPYSTRYRTYPGFKVYPEILDLPD